MSSAIGAGIEHVVVTVNDYTKQQDFAAASVVLDTLGEPGRPATPLSGTAPADGIVDLAFLDSLMTEQRVAG